MASAAARARLLVVDDEPSMRQMLEILLAREGHRVELAANCAEARTKLRSPSASFDLVITDLVLPDGSGLDVLSAAIEEHPEAQVILITAYATTAQAVEAMRRGAYDYVQKPFGADEFRATVDKALDKRRLVRENRALRTRAGGAVRFSDIVGESAAMRGVLEVARKVAPTPSNVLLTGESGTGKEIVARAIHADSAPDPGPFVVVNCGAVPANLMESELFGHAKGAFTGAVRAHEGLFRVAHGGTLFLDEIGEVPLALQVKLLRAIQEKSIRPVGAEVEYEVDVRILAATNKDLDVEVAAERFRSDLFYRLNVIHIRLPPLRERREDLPRLVEENLARAARELRKPVRAVSEEAMNWLLAYDYPGNVRELMNLIDRAVTLASGPEITRAELPAEGARAGASLGNLSDLPLDEAIAQLERARIESALAAAGGNRTRAAALLGITFRSLRYRLKKLGFDAGTAETPPSGPEPPEPPEPSDETGG